MNNKLNFAVIAHDEKKADIVAFIMQQEQLVNILSQLVVKLIN